MKNEKMKKRINSVFITGIYASVGYSHLADRYNQEGIANNYHKTI